MGKFGSGEKVIPTVMNMVLLLNIISKVALIKEWKKCIYMEKIPSDIVLPNLIVRYIVCRVCVAESVVPPKRKKTPIGPYKLLRKLV